MARGHRMLMKGNTFPSIMIGGMLFMNNNNCLCRIFDDCNIWIIIIALLIISCCCCNN